MNPIKPEISQQMQAMQQLIEQMPQALFVLSAEGEIIGCNQALRVLLGYPPEPPSSKSRLKLADILSGIDQSRLLASPPNSDMPLACALINRFGGRVFVQLSPWEIRVPASDTTFIGCWVEPQVKPSLSPQHLLEGLASITESLQLDEIASRILDNIAEFVPYDAGAIMTFLDGRLRVIGHRGFEQFGLEDWIKDFSFTVADSPKWQRRAEQVEPTIIADTHQDSRWESFPQTAWVRAHLMLPTIYAGKIIGFINLDSTQVAAFRPEHAQLLLPFTYYAATAIHNAELYEAERSQRQLAEALIDIRASFSSTLNLSEVLERILDHIGRILPHDTANIVIYEGGRYHVASSRGYDKFGLAEWIQNYEIDQSLQDEWSRHAIDPQPFLVADTAEMPTWITAAETSWIRSHIEVPILLGGELLGLVNVNSARPNTFQPEHIARLTPFSNQAAAAIHNARLFEAEHQQRRFAEALISITEALNSTHNLSQLLHTLLEKIDKVFNHETANVMRLEGRRIFIVAHRGYEKYNIKGWLDNLSFDLLTSPDFLQAVETRQPVLIPDTRVHPHWQDIPETKGWLLCHVKAPIKIGGQVVGFLNLDGSQPHQFRPNILPQLQALTDQVAIAIHNAELFEAERRQRRLAEGLQQSLAAINSSLNLAEVCERILSQIEAVLPPYGHISISTIESDERLVFISTRKYDPDLNDEDLYTGTYTLRDFKVARHMLKTRAPLIISDVWQDPDPLMPDQVADQWIGSFAGAPLLDGDTVIGFIAIGSRQTKVFKAEHKAILAAFAAPAATAIRNARLFEAERRQRKLAEGLQESIAALNRSLNLHEMLDYMLNFIERMMPTADYLTISFINPDNSLNFMHTRVNAEHVDESVLFERQRYLDEFPALRHMKRTGQPLIIPDVTSPNSPVQNERSSWVRSYAGVPLQLDDEIIGFITLVSEQQGQFTTDYAPLLKAFAAPAAAAIRNARLFESERSQRLMAETLRDSAASLNQHLHDLSASLETLFDQIERVMPPEANIGLSLLVPDDNPSGLAVRVLRARWYHPPDDPDKIYASTFPIDTPATYYMSHMTHNRVPVLVVDTAKNPHWEPVHHMSKMRSFIGTPLIADDKVLGFINLSHPQPGYFHHGHLDKLMSFANTIVVGLRNAQLYADLTSERARLQAIIDGTGEGILYTEGVRISYVNQKLCQITGFSPDELIGQPIYFLREAYEEIRSDLDFRNTEDVHLPELQSGEHELRLRRRDGGRFDAHLVVSRLDAAPDPEDENHLRMVALVRDISNEKQLKTLQNRFVTHAAHEFRQPISNIVTRLYLLRRSPEQLEKHVQVLEMATNRLMNLADHMNTIAEFNLGHIRLNKYRVVLQEAFLSTVESLISEAADQGLMLTFAWPDEPTEIIVDISLVLQLVRLLASHAILYSENGDTIRLYFTVENRHFIMRVEGGKMPDSGMELQQFFEPFYIPSEGELIRTGLELTIVRQIIELHKGTVQVERNAQAEAIFIIQLPMNGTDEELRNSHMRLG